MRLQNRDKCKKAAATEIFRILQEQVDTEKREKEK
jgi:hypothetical protein